jgi:hypothetical protein
MKIQQTFYMKKDLYTDLKVICAKLGISRTEYINNLIIKDIELIKKNVSRETNCDMRFLNYDNVCITDCDIENCSYRKKED